MKAVILAAGKGVRLMPLTKNKPKGMVEVSGKPILHHIFEALPKEIDEVILVISPAGESIREYFGQEYKKKKINYVICDKALGTGHALFQCEEALGRGKFLMLYGDDLQSKSAMERIIKHDLAMLLFEHENSGRFGVVGVNKDGHVTSYEENPKNPKSKLIAVGVNVLDERIFKYPLKLSTAGEYWINNPLMDLMREHPLKHEITDFWHPIGYPEDIRSAEELFKKELYD